MPNDFVVMTVTAQGPGSSWGHHRKIAVLEVEPGTTPKMISLRARGVIRIVKVWDRLYVGGPRSAFARALAEAIELRDRLRARAKRAKDCEHEHPSDRSPARLPQQGPRA